MKSHFIQKFFHSILKKIHQGKILFTLLKKEKVFKYFLIIISLMILSSLLFFLLEYSKVVESLPDKDKLSHFDKIVTVLYWSITTISTCGFGDIIPSTNSGRLLVIFVLFFSIASVSLFTANLASALTTKRMMERRGIMDLSNLTNHYIICGWKKNMSKLLIEIKTLNPKLKMKQLVIIANIDADELELFKQQFPEFEEIYVLRGEHFNENLLKKANVSQCQKVMILADELTQGGETEKDSKTVMTAMVIRSISESVKICAELLDIKFEKYLQNAHVEDIIYTSEYSKSLIANTFVKPGTAKIFNDLMDINFEMNRPAFLSTEEIPKSLLGKEFHEARHFFKEKKNQILIGILENVGTYKDRKDEALREAQKTADVQKLILQLKNAKKMESNLPQINPEDTYIICPHSRAIIIGSQRI